MCLLFPEGSSISLCICWNSSRSGSAFSLDRGRLFWSCSFWEVLCLCGGVEFWKNLLVLAPKCIGRSVGDTGSSDMWFSDSWGCVQGYSGNRPEVTCLYPLFNKNYPPMDPHYYFASLWKATSAKAASYQQKDWFLRVQVPWCSFCQVKKKD